jgi:late competence protein required for DNA uptake (superfamily II DNA/RNA helicase)
MVSKNLQYNMLETKFYGESFVEEKIVEELDEDGEVVERTVQENQHESTACADPQCRRPIKHDEPCFIDTISGETYCDSCGRCLRYERKMETKRDLYAKIRAANGKQVPAS